MNIRQGDQLLAMVELRNILEKWAMLSVSDADSTYDLTEMRNDLREYFLPQQWNKKKKPTARDMYKFAYTLHGKTDPNETKGFLGEMAWLLKAAHAGDCLAEMTVGSYFAECKDFHRYLYWTKNSARHGCDVGFFNLGQSYARGMDGVRRNYKTALRYFLKAEKLGYKNATSEIGHCYMKLRDYKKAKHWLDKAVSVGNDEYAYCHLGGLYEEGLGVPKSKAVAIGYYITSGDMGLKCAQKAAERLRGRSILFE